MGAPFYLELEGNHAPFVSQVAAAPGLPVRTRLLVLLTASDILKCAPCPFCLEGICSLWCQCISISFFGILAFLTVPSNEVPRFV